jgi:putative addiction module CopG family antidote
MQINLRHRELEQFIDEQVKSGRYRSADDVVATAVARLMDDQIELSEEDLAAITEAGAEIDRGDVENFADFASRARKKHGIG